ncbi:MAG: ATP-binding cassette domain-containing protein [Acidobacteria bacterium]|nr:ATP-binding cassette domain-containing protein [Acidobacteriota bacterium]
MKRTDFLQVPVSVLLKEQPFVSDFFEAQGILPGESDTRTVEKLILDLPDDKLEDLGIDRKQLSGDFVSFMEGMAVLAEDDGIRVRSLTVLGGHDKSGKPENAELVLKPGDVVSIVGPTGSGKSRLLADIEWMADNDTPTGRKILINGKIPDKNWRFSPEHKLVAQLSQNMNFVMDLSAREFITMHAESRFIQNPNETVNLILEEANKLAGESFEPDAPITSLSGGQSRALMIADTAFLSRSPIVLIDEIENAGIDRKKALELLIREEKIVLMATHDLILALMADRRVVIQNGGIAAVLETSEPERANLDVLERMDRKLLELRNRLRTGDRIEEIEQEELHA